MKALVAVKRVIDYQVKVRVKADQSGVEAQNIKMSMNPFDEIALEETLRLKEKGVISEIIAVSIGTDQCQETLRHALALGADRAILVETKNELEPLNIAKILQKICEQENIQAAFLGKQAIDDDCNQTAQMLAGLLNWGQATFASKVEFSDQRFMVTREIDSGLETVSVSVPCVISVDLRLNQPRFASLPNIMKAKAKPLQKIAVADLNLDLKAHSEILRVEKPLLRQAGVKMDSIAAVLERIMP